MNFIPPTQHGFVQQRSVYSAISETWDDFTAAIDSRQNIDVIYLDIKSAFDHVDHSLLLHKLAMFGFGPNTTEWIKNFLNNRSMSVKIGKQRSSIVTLPKAKGVPQGAVLSPLLFNLFISDITSIITDDITIKQYADDIKVYVMYSKASLNRAQKLQDFLDRFNLWCNSLGLGLSLHKIHILYFGSSNPNTQYFINGTPIVGNQYNISYRNYISDLTFLHHTIINPKTIAARNRPISNSYTYSLKNKSRFKLPHTRTSLRQKSFFIRATREFNKLPTELQDSVCNHNFRRELIKHSCRCCDGREARIKDMSHYLIIN
jgi:hypothetical protein